MPYNYYFFEDLRFSMSPGVRLRRFETAGRAPRGEPGRRPRDLVGDGGADRDRTGDLRLARAALSQLSYSPGIRSPEVQA
jgi:hypothetical protein